MLFDMAIHDRAQANHSHAQAPAPATTHEAKDAQATREQYNAADARLVLDHIATHDQYGWVKTGIDADMFAALLNDITAFRNEYAAKHDAHPTSREVYRKFRHAHELGEIPVEVVSALDAMMGGNPRDGELVDFEAIIQATQ